MSSLGTVAFGINQHHRARRQGRSMHDDLRGGGGMKVDMDSMTRNYDSAEDPGQIGI